MINEDDFQEEPLDFSEHARWCSCPYCGETLSMDEISGALNSNTFICPSCRKKLNVHELGNGF